MVEIDKLSKEELMEYCINKKLKGCSYRDFSDLFEKNQIERETRNLIFDKLDEIDKIQKIAIEKEEKKGQKNRGVKSTLIGIAIALFGAFLFYNSAKAGIFFVLNFVVLGAGAVFLFKGILDIIAGSINKN